MAQHDYNIANQTGLEFRADINNLAQAIATQNSGPTEPTTTYAGMVWLDTSTSPPTEKRRNAANNGWETTLTEAGRTVAGAANSAAQRTAIGAQETLVSGTNIKTINGESVLGSGNIAISAGLAAASTAEAQAGTSNTVAITPLRLREGLNASGAAPIYACRAWVNFNGTGTVAIRASGNVSSITDNGTGDYTVNFTTAMPDANYAPVITCGTGDGTLNRIHVNTYRSTTTLATSYRIQVFNEATTAAVDDQIVSVAIFR